VTILPSPWPQLNALSLGFRAGELILVTGKAKRGRTWVLLTMANEAARSLPPNRRVLVFPTTTTAREVQMRLYAIRAKQSYNTVRRCAVDQLAEIGERDERIAVFDPSMLSPTFDALVERAVSPTVGLFVDDMMFSGGRSRDPRRGETHYASRLKQLAISHSIPIIATAHSDRSGYGLPRGLADYADIVLRLDPSNAVAANPRPKKLFVDAAREFHTDDAIPIKFNPAAGEYGGP